MGVKSSQEDWKRISLLEMTDSCSISGTMKLQAELRYYFDTLNLLQPQSPVLAILWSVRRKGNLYPCFTVKNTAVLLHGAPPAAIYFVHSMFMASGGVEFHRFW
jgi:hypothetical protein